MTDVQTASATTAPSRPAGQGRLQAFLGHPHLGRWLAGMAILLSAPSLGLGFFLDEHTARYIYSDLPRAEEMYQSYSGGYGIANGDPTDTHNQVERGWAPWWVNPELMTSLMRPLSEWTHRVDVQWWPHSAFMMRLHSLLWLAAFVLIGTRAYRRVLGPVVGGAAALLLAVDHTHGYSVGYVANRHALVSGVFALLCLDQHLAYRLQGSRRGAVLAPVCYVLSLLGGESGVAVAAYLFGFACFYEGGPFSRRLLSFSPYLVVTLVWRIVYTILGYGASGSGVYTDPGREPLRFLGLLAERGPILFLGQFFVPPAEVYAMLGSGGAKVMWAFAVVLLVLLSAAFGLLLLHDRIARCWVTGFALSLVPAAATVPNNRQLLLASVGAMALLAQLWFLYDRLFRTSSSPPFFIVLPAKVAGTVGLFHLVVSPLLLPLTTCSIALSAPVHRGIVGGGDEIAGRDVVFVTAPDIFAVKFVQIERRIEERPPARRFRALSFGPQPVAVIRPAVDTLVLDYPAGVVDTPFMEMFRDSRLRMQPGDRVELEGLSIEVRAITADGRLKRVRFRFSEPLDAPQLLFYRWRSEGFVPFTLPEVGQRVDLPAAPPELGLSR